MTLPLRLDSPMDAHEARFAIADECCIGTLVRNPGFQTFLIPPEPG